MEGYGGRQLAGSGKEDEEDIYVPPFLEVPCVPGLPDHDVIHLRAAWNWADFFSRLNISMHGHTNTKRNKESNETAVHVFRFVLRADVDSLGFSEAPQRDPINTYWPHIAPRPDDVILLTKLYIASTSLSQPPMVFCPAEFMEVLNIKDLALARSAVLSDRQSKELSKSAFHFRREPLNMQQASEYLDSLVACDGTPQGAPPPCPFLFEDEVVLQFETISGDEHAAPEAPAGLGNPAAAVVSVEGAGARAPRMGRPASSGQSTLRRRPAAVPDASAGAPDAAMDPLAPLGAGVPAERRRGRGALELPPLQPGQTLGCSKCRNLPNGCGECRTALGWVRVTKKKWRVGP